MEASSASSISAGGEYDRVLLRLASTNDAKLQPVIDRLLPMVLNQLQLLPSNAPAAQRTKILEIVNHILLRLRANSTLNVPVKEILDLWWKAGVPQGSASLGQKLFYNMSLVFLELGQSRIPAEGPEAEAFAKDVLSGLDRVPADYQPSLALMAFQHVGRHGSRKNKPAQGFELGSVVYEMAADFLSIPTRVSAGNVPVPAAWLTGQSAESWRSALRRSKDVTRSVEDLANTKVDVVEFIGDFGRPNESYVPLLVGSVDGYDRVSRIAQSYISRISPELKADDSILIDRVIDSSSRCPLAGIPASFLASCAQTLARGSRVLSNDKSEVESVMDMVIGVLKQGNSASTQLQRSMVTLSTRILEASPEQAYALLPVLSSRIGYGSELGVLYRLVCESIARNRGDWSTAAPLEALARLLRPNGGGNGLTSDSECAVSLAYLLLRSQARDEALRLLREAVYLRPEPSLRQLAANSLLNGLLNSEPLKWVMAAIIRADPDAGVRDCGRQPDPALLGPRARMPVGAVELAETVKEEGGHHRRLCRADWSLEQGTSLLELLTAACSSGVVEPAEVLSEEMTSLINKAGDGGRIHEAVEGCYVCRELPDNGGMLDGLVALGATGISERDREHAAAALTHHKDSRKIRADLIGSSDSSAVCLGCDMVSGEVEPELGDRLKELALEPTTAARDNVAAHACRAIARAIGSVPVNLDFVKRLEDAMTCPHRGSAVLELFGAAGAHDGEVREWVEQKCRQLIGRKDSDLKMKDAVAGCLVACGSEIPAEPLTIRALYIVHYLSDASRATNLETLLSWLDTLLASCLKEPPEDSTEQAVLGDVCIKTMVMVWVRARR
ncbi:proteasome component M29 [Perkinsus chesapeaki]|uniref:Proteasome component M29 n=1 Tax=Perkinsus chesapeaki TaxID=330153 RepID=A0A7J6LJL9_PERCH|nr:proteasome component M29 [Perkinsus chesapeaki]